MTTIGEMKKKKRRKSRIVFGKTRIENVKRDRVKEGKEQKASKLKMKQKIAIKYI